MVTPPPDRYRGDRARVELDYEHACARLLRILQHRSKYTDEQYTKAEAAERAARQARRDAYGEWYKELEGWSDQTNARSE